MINDRLLNFPAEIDIKSYNVHCKMLHRFGGEGSAFGYFRPGFVVKNLDMDNSSKANMKALVNSAENKAYTLGENGQKIYTDEFKGLIETLWKGVKEELRQNRKKFWKLPPNQNEIEDLQQAPRTCNPVRIMVG